MLLKQSAVSREKGFSIFDQQWYAIILVSVCLKYILFLEISSPSHTSDLGVSWDRSIIAPVLWLTLKAKFLLSSIGGANSSFSWLEGLAGVMLFLNFVGLGGRLSLVPVITETEGPVSANEPE